MERPHQADQRHTDGLRFLNAGRPAEAEACFREVVAACAEWPEAHTHLGVALAARGQHAEALACFERAVALNADDAEGHNHLGNTLKRLGRVMDAIEHYREAVRVKPCWGEAHNGLGLALRVVGDLDGALEAFRRALADNPAQVDARNNLGVTLSDKGMLDEAAASYRQALRLMPGSHDFHNNLAVVLAQQKKRAEAIAHYRRALELNPKYAEAHNNLGNSLRAEAKLDEAEAALREAIRLKPEYAEAYNNLAIILMKQERVDEALANYQKALALKPDYPDGHKNYGLALLIKGDFAAGWKEYESRWGTKEMPVRQFAQPRWDGGPLEGKTILLYAEQGLGDTIQFIRYAAVVKRCGVGQDSDPVGRFGQDWNPVLRSGVTVVVECQKPLVELFAGCPGIDRVVAQGEPLPKFDTHVALLSIPLIVGSDLASIPAEVPYLSADDERLRTWGEELKGVTGLKVGIVWQGNRGFQDDSTRSVRLALLEPLARVPGVRLVSLQKGYGSEQLQHARDWNVIDLGNRLDSFADTAAVIQQLDLVISVDTAVGHLAGALGVPVWIALPTAPDWRWLERREDSPWYPTARLFRQQKRGDWAEVFQRMARELDAHPRLQTAERCAQRGRALLSGDRVGEAAALLQRAIELDPNNGGLHNDHAFALDRLGKRAEALAGFAEAVRLKPDFAEALCNVGNMLRRTGRPAEAEARYRQALPLMKDSADLCNNLGIVLLDQAKHAEAESAFRRSLRLKPDDAGVHNNLGVLFEQMGRIDEAVACYRESLRLKPDAVDTHKNLALGLLRRGDWLRGFAAYEWRCQSPGGRQSPDLGGRGSCRAGNVGSAGAGVVGSAGASPSQTRALPTGGPRRFAQPRWDGRPLLGGEAVLLHAEQGLGDTIQFVRYARLVKERGATLLVDCPAELARVLGRCCGIDRVIRQGTPLPEFAYQLPMLSLPTVFCTTVNTVPPCVPYLTAEPELVEKWGRELAGVRGLRVGIVWQGSRGYGGDAHRSAPLRALAPLAGIAGVQLISLQKGHGTEQLRDADGWNVIDLGSRLGDFADTAAVMKHLDLVISVDTAVVHLAGALGVPVWVALCTASDWRWLQGREDTPWYPSARLFRQPRWGNWAAVFGRMADGLRQKRTVTAPVVAEIALSELFDKIAMLEIDRSRLDDEDQLARVQMELGRLRLAKSRSVKTSADLDSFVQLLREANEKRQQIEEDLDLCASRAGDEERLRDLATLLHRVNRRRCETKRQIDDWFVGHCAESQVPLAASLRHVPAA